MKSILILIGLYASISLHCHSAPTVPSLNNGPSSQPFCPVLLNVNIIHDSTCLQNVFQDDALVLYPDDDNPVRHTK